MSLNVGAVAYNPKFQALSNYNNNFNNAEQPVLQSGVKFDTFPQQEKKSNGLLKNVGFLTVVAAGVDLVFFKGKHIKGILEKLGIKWGKAKTPEVKEPQVVNPVRKPSKKKRIKHTSDTGASKPITNKREAEVVQNINTQHASNADRKLVAQAEKEVVTPEMQAQYDKDIAFVEMTQEQKMANSLNNMQNRQQAAKLNSIENNSKGGKQLTQIKKELEIAEKAPRKVLQGEYILDGNKYIIKDGKITEMTLKGAQKPQTKELSILKHEEKNHILARLLKGEGEETLAVAA